MQTQSRYKSYASKFMGHQQILRSGPAEPHQCRDLIFLVIFIILMLLFFGVGLYYIIDQPHAPFHAQQIGIDAFVDPLTIVQKIVVKYWIIILSMGLLAGILAMLYLYFVRVCTKVMVYSMIVLSIVLMIAVIVVCALKMYWILVGTFGALLLLMISVLFCVRKSVKKGIVLLRICMQFLYNRPKVILISLGMLVPMFAFLSFWTYGLLCLQYKAYQNQIVSKQLHANLTKTIQMEYGSNNMNLLQQQPFNMNFNAFNNIDVSNIKQTVFYGFWIFMFSFITIFLYYVMVYLLANCCAHWYYDKKQLGFTKGMRKLCRYHIGSLTFATLIIAVIRIIHKITENLANRNSVGAPCVSMCLCCVSMCLRQIQQLIQVLNNYSVITMSLTGESFVESAKTTIGLIYQDFQLFFISNIISELVQAAGIVLCAGLPTLIGWLIIQLKQNKSENIHDYQRVIIVVLMFFVCLAVAIFFIAFVSQIVSMIFVFYCLDKRYRNMGVTIETSPVLLQNIYFDKQILSEGNDAHNDIVPATADRFS